LSRRKLNNKKKGDYQMNLVKKLIGKRGSEVVQNVLVLGAMGIIAILVMTALHGGFDAASDTAVLRVGAQVSAPAGVGN